MLGLLETDRSGPRRLRELLRGPRPVVAPRAYDAMSALLVEQAGFPAVYMSGFGATASLLGRPDIGLLTMSEMTDAARRIVSAVGIPVIADADNGYGNAINVIRTVHEYEAAGVAAIHLKDQPAPKRCGHMKGKEVIPAGTMAGKIEAAVQACDDLDFVIVARTDARRWRATTPRSGEPAATARQAPTCSSWRPYGAAPRSRRPRRPSRTSRCCSTGPRAAGPRPPAWTA